jgi:hypothetical protein
VGGRSVIVDGGWIAGVSVRAEAIEIEDGETPAAGFDHPAMFGRA